MAPRWATGEADTSAVPFSFSLEIVFPNTAKLIWANSNGSHQAQHRKQPLGLKATGKEELREIVAKCRAAGDLGTSAG